jgi:hypothetical protein
MEALIVKAVYIAFGLVAIGIGAYAGLFPDGVKQFFQDQQPDRWAKDRIEKSDSWWLFLLGWGGVVFGASLVIKALTSD